MKDVESAFVDADISFAKSHIHFAAMALRRGDTDEVRFELDKALAVLAKVQRNKWYAEQEQAPVVLKQKQPWWRFWG